MIIVQLKGGLGNQLFQYAAGIALSKHHNVPLKVDISELGKADAVIGTVRNYELQHLIEPPEIATAAEVEKYLKQSFFSKYFQKLLPPYKRAIYKEAAFTYDINFFKASPPFYLKGYRQSERYFKNCEPLIRHAFQVKRELVANVTDFLLQVKATNSVSIHIRRGDYNNPIVQAYHGVLGVNYYQAAIKYIQANIPNPTFYVFSDSIEWVKENLSFDAPVVFVSGTISKNHYEDFFLMTLCRHNIIANSSFSWWAAWLNNNKDKKVIAPLNWFKAKINTEDLILKDWTRL
ncbi:MAG: alpha,2-fucosyltransferase [Segetibacter sp.]|nr:alpha,2-fucosyltransferase [Segetibacter sp.]